jgi:TolB-like protein
MSLKGSVRKAGGSVRVTGRMIDASTGAHVWAERYAAARTMFLRARSK